MEQGIFLRTDEAARAVGLSRNFLYRHARHIPASRRAGKALRWDLIELRNWMAALARAEREMEPVPR